MSDEMSDALWRGVKQVCHLVVQTTCVGSTQTPEMFFTVKNISYAVLLTIAE